VALRKFLVTMLSLLIALTAFSASFVAIAFAAEKLLTVIYERPGDFSSGDTAGWAFLTLSPLIVPLDILISLGLAALVFRVSRARLRRRARPKPMATH
jgi:hypothetical protein